jgi:hypothetical protein
MANATQVLTYYTKDMLRQVKNNLQFCKNTTNENLTGRFTAEPKVGETINVRKPARFVGRTGETYTAEDYIERSIPVSVGTTQGVDIDFLNRELMFQVDYVRERVLGPAAKTLANKLDGMYLAAAIQGTANFVGAQGTIPTAMKTYNQARAKIVNEGAPQDDHVQLMSPDMSVEIVEATKGLFQSSEQIKQGFEKGILGLGAGAKWYEVQNLYTHTVGPLGGTPLVNGAAQGIATGFATTTSLVTDGWTAAAASRLKKGDVFTIANVFAVNPWTRSSTGALRQFVVTADVSSDGSGNATVVVSPAIISAGPYQNVSAAPADNAAITVFAAANTVGVQGFRFHPEAFIFGTLQQPKPDGAVEFCGMETDPDTGITIRFIRDWNTTANKQVNRFDVVPYFGIANPEWACRVGSLT